METDSGVIERPPLAIQLHSSTRKEHASLNQSIIARLPLCLPPYTDSPLLYAAGITVFANIYYAIEQAWTDLVKRENMQGRQHSLLLQLYTQNLFRTARLRSDLGLIVSRLDATTQHQLQTLEDASFHFQTRILERIRRKPHIVLAWAWAMYLALFNGGRWMRQQFTNAGPDFWCSRERTIDCLSLWQFDGTQDGEDIKDTFKQNFQRAASLLTDDEQADVVAEGKVVFDTCLELVHFLDATVASMADSPPLSSQTATAAPSSSQVEPWMLMVWFHAFSLLSQFWQAIRRICLSLSVATKPNVVGKEGRAD